MANFQERRLVRQFLYSRITAIALFATALFVANGAWGAYLKYDEVRSHLRAAEEGLAALAAREAILKRDIMGMKTNYGVEKEIRENFGLAREGERAIIIIEPKESFKAEQPILHRSFWTRMKNSLTNL